MNEIQFILYQLPDEDSKVQVVIKDEIIEEGELIESSVISKMETTAFMTKPPKNIRLFPKWK